MIFTMIFDLIYDMMYNMILDMKCKMTNNMTYNMANMIFIKTFDTYIWYSILHDLQYHNVRKTVKQIRVG